MSYFPPTANTYLHKQISKAKNLERLLEMNLNALNWITRLSVVKDATTKNLWFWGLGHFVGKMKSKSTATKIILRILLVHQLK